MYPGGVPDMPWAGYLAEENGSLVGTCAFKAPPDSRGVEIAYFTFPQFEGRGVATKLIATVADLEKIALDDDADVEALKGWRRELFGEDALKLKRGEIALVLNGPRVEVVEIE